jgi:hypothetical protein
MKKRKENIKDIEDIENKSFFGNNAKRSDAIVEDLGFTRLGEDFVTEKGETLSGRDILNPVELKKAASVSSDDIFIRPISELASRLKSLEKPKGFFNLDRLFYDWQKRKIEKELSKMNEDNKKYQDTLKARDLKKIVKNFSNLVERRGLLDIQGWKNQIADNKTPGKTLLINMELRNGFHVHFQVTLSDKWFDYDDGRFIIDDTFKYYTISSGLWSLDYHQDCCIPLKRRVDVNEILQAVAESAEIDTETSINPKSLKIFMESDIIQKIMQSAQMDAWIKFVKLMLIIIVAINAITLLLILKSVFG